MIYSILIYMYNCNLFICLPFSISSLYFNLFFFEILSFLDDLEEPAIHISKFESHVTACHANSDGGFAAEYEVIKSSLNAVKLVYKDHSSEYQRGRCRMHRFFQYMCTYQAFY